MAVSGSTWAEVYATESDYVAEHDHLAGAPGAAVKMIEEALLEARECRIGRQTE